MPSAEPYPWIAGNGWPRNTIVRLTVHFHGRVERATLRTRSNGRLGAAIVGVRWCTGLVIEATDATKHRVVLHGASPFNGCPAVTEGNRIVIRPLTEREFSARQYLIDARKPARSYTIHLGDMVFVYVQQHCISLHGLDTRHYHRIERGTIPECPPNADCLFPPCAYYRVRATHPGNTALPLGRRGAAPVRVVPRD